MINSTTVAGGNMKSAVIETRIYQTLNNLI